VVSLLTPLAPRSSALMRGDLTDIHFVDSDEHTRHLRGLVIHATRIMEDHPFQGGIQHTNSTRGQLLFGKGVEPFPNGASIRHSGRERKEEIVRTLAIFLHRDANKWQPHHANELIVDQSLMCHEYVNVPLRSTVWRDGKHECTSAVRISWMPMVRDDLS
jgi:hypothetical protein